MKDMLRYGMTLSIICVVASGLLAGVNKLTKAKIVAQAQLEEELSLKEVLPKAVRFEPVKSAEEVIYYKAFDVSGNLLGVAFKAIGKGYSSNIETMVGMFKNGTVNSIKVLSQNETPGLGTNIAEKDFTGRFVDKNIKDLGNVQAITGATISSRAVINSVDKKSQEIQELIKND
ncbi:MAG: RnfABCDGE type electron transport complex subunit G [Candidatus Omnitrophica bacterium]|nr:RnfABCDGE type electron transport complex subunit G [Candidatus Omnitrophota bacterium]